MSEERIEAGLSGDPGPTPIRQLTPHLHSTLFPMMSEVEQAELEADMRQRGQREPIVLFEGQILDGRNRYLACVRIGIEPRIVEFTGEDPVALVMSANLHRRHLTQEQKQAVIATLLAEEPTRSDRAIGRIVHVDGKTVGAIRSELETRAEIPHVATREDSKGRSYPAHRGRKAEPSPAWRSSQPRAARQARPPIADPRVLSDANDIERHFDDLLQTLSGAKELIAALPKMLRETMTGAFIGKFLSLFDIPADDLGEKAILPAFVAALLAANAGALVEGASRSEP